MVYKSYSFYYLMNRTPINTKVYHYPGYITNGPNEVYVTNGNIERTYFCGFEPKIRLIKDEYIYYTSFSIRRLISSMWSK